MKTIYKYQLEVTDEQVIKMPAYAEILTVQIQDGIPCIWVAVNTVFADRDYKIRTIGTGNPIEKEFKGRYIGTYQLQNGSLVFHVFLT